LETRLKPVARTGKFKEECQGCNQQVDFTDQMVLDNIIQGLSDEDIKRKVLAMPESDCTLEKVIKFIEAEETGKYSLSDTKDLASVEGMSTYKKQQRVTEGEAPPAMSFAD
jgi:tRNA G26 N,N-dimethylase Trm1